MLLAILSDTHLPRAGRAVPAECLARCRSADAILHAGDLIEPSVLELLGSLGPPVHAVAGNVDNADVRALLPPRLELAFEGVRIGMVHSPGPRNGRVERLRARFPRADAVIFGHTHTPQHEQRDGFQIFNPGSPTDRRRAPTHTFGLARVRAASIEFELLEL
jgi:putative phosphoesterase